MNQTKRKKNTTRLATYVSENLYTKRETQHELLQYQMNNSKQYIRKIYAQIYEQRKRDPLDNTLEEIKETLGKREEVIQIFILKMKNSTKTG